MARGFADIVSGVVNDPHRPPALSPLAYIKYPAREILISRNCENQVTVRFPKKGWHYKNHGPRPKFPPTVDAAGVMAALAILQPQFVAIEVVDYSKFISVTFIIKEDAPPCQ